MLALLGITTLGSSLVPTVVNGAIALMLFVAAPMASIVQFVVQILNPCVRAYRTIYLHRHQSGHPHRCPLAWGRVFPVAAYGELHHPGYLGREFNTPFTSGQPVAPALLVWAILYCIALPVLAAVRFQHRDL